MIFVIIIIVIIIICNVIIIIVIIIAFIVITIITCAAITLCLSAMSVHFGQRQSLHQQYLLDPVFGLYLAFVFCVFSLFLLFYFLRLIPLHLCLYAVCASMINEHSVIKGRPTLSADTRP